LAVVRDICCQVLENKPVQIRVIGWSMGGLIDKGDQIIVVKADIHDVKFGDIVILYDTGNLICHRVFRNKYIDSVYTLFTRGDWAVDYDLPVTLDNFIGLVVAIRKSSGVIDLRRALWKALNILIAYYAVGIFPILLIGSGIRQRYTQFRRFMIWRILSTLALRLLQSVSKCTVGFVNGLYGFFRW